MQMSAWLRRNSVCGPGCPEIVVVDDGIAFRAVGPNRPMVSVCTCPAPFKSRVPEAAAAVFWQSISLGRRAAPGSAQDLGFYRLGRGLPLNSSRRCLQELDHL